MEFKAALLVTYEIWSLGNLSWFLGIRVVKTNNELYLYQDSYIKKLIEKYTSIGPSL